MENICKNFVKNKKIKVKIFGITESSDKLIKEILECSLKECEMLDLRYSIYTCIKELIVNAIKVNYKRIFFQQADKKLPYHEVLKLFKLEMTESEMLSYIPLAKKYNFYTNLSFQLKKDIFTLKIETPTQMTKQEKENINKKIEAAKVCNNIAEYFLKTMDDDNNEGAGIGLILVIMMLKSLGLTQKNLKFYSSSKTTTTLLTIPLTEETKTNFVNSLND